MMREVHIRARRGWLDLDWRELVESRDVLAMLVAREWSALYKQTILGPLWYVLQPMLMTVLFTVIFGHVARIPTDGIPPFLFYLSGIVFWNYFQGVLNHAAFAFTANVHILTKVYVPRLLIPFSGVVIQLLHFAVHFSLLAGFFAFYLWRGADLSPTAWAAALPFLLLQTAAAGLGVGLWVCAATIKYRDLRFALPFMIQLGMYLSPVVYPLSVVTDPRLRFLLALNPMTSVIETARLGITGQGHVDPTLWAIGAGVTFFLAVTGILVFNRVQRTFADTI